MQMDTRDELLPCPWCGNEPSLIRSEDMNGEFTVWHSIQCGHCGIDGGDEYFEDAVKWWNTRAVNAYPALVEALDEARDMLKLYDELGVIQKIDSALALSARGDGS